MAASNLNLGKASGGVLNIQPADGTTTTSLVLPASGTVVATDVAVTDNAIVRFDGTTGKVQNSGVIIDDNGNVGVGAAPSSWVSSFKVLQQQNTSISSNFNEQYITSNGYYNGSNWVFLSDNGASQYLNNQGMHIWKRGSSGTAGSPITWTNAMTLDSNGNLGIGVTPSAWRTAQKVIEIAGSGALSNFNGLENVTLSTNMYINSSNQFIYKNNGYASYYSQSNSVHQWLTAPSGTAGNSITWINAMTLDANGNLNTNGIIRAGNGASTDGSVVLTAKYDNGQNPNNLGTQCSSSAWELCFGVKPKPGSMGNYVSSVDNVSWSRGVLTVSNELSFKTASSTTTPIGSDVAMTERMRIDANGTLQTNRITIYNTAVSQGDGIINSSGDFRTYLCSADGSNAAATMARFSKNSTTSRSINAGGTINASGADYAEYEYSNDITLVKGQIVGFKSDGTLTDKYSESIRFAIKSTNPSIVGGDVWGCEEIVGKKPEQPVKTEEMTDEEFAKLEEQYEKDLADFEVRLETERQKVDRIAYAGKVPVNVYGAVAGQYVIAIEKEDGTIGGKLINKSDITFSEYQDAVGRVNKILDDGRAEVAVIIH